MHNMHNIDAFHFMEHGLCLYSVGVGETYH